MGATTTNKTANITTPATADKPAQRSFADAYAKYKDIIDAVPDSELLPINVDIASVVTMVCGAWPQIVALRSEVESLSHIDMAQFDSIEGLALSLGHAQSLYLAVNGPSEALPPLAAEAQKTREVLLAEVKLLGKRGLIDASFADSFRGGPSYKTIAFELLALVNCLRTLPPAAAARIQSTAEELDAAEALMHSMTQELGAREVAPAVVAAASHARQQNFTLLAGAYEEARHAIIFLRRKHGDADELAPSIYAGRGGRRAVTDVDDGAVSVIGGSGAGGAGGAAVTPRPRIEPGMPGSSPFIDEP